VVDRGDVGVRAQARLECVLAVQGVDRVRRVAGDPPRLGGELGGQLDDRQSCVQGGLKKNGTEIRSSGYFGDTTRWFVAIR
jgi:hypothetical protein